MMKVYISGPITGYADLNRLAFEEAKRALEALDYMPISPLDVCLTAPDYWKWEDYMRADIEAMMKCGAIMMLDGWEQSRGAKIEHDLAEALGFRFI
ncbi:MAG: DUF4406 domain-containing protein [Polynucleobacter sp.]